MTPDEIEELARKFDKLIEKRSGLTEIKIIPSEMMIEGIGILMLHPKDYEAYKNSTATLKP